MVFDLTLWNASLDFELNNDKFTKDLARLRLLDILDAFFSFLTIM